MAYIEAKDIHKTFGKGDAAVHALRGVSLSVDKGEMVAVMGKSGSGKSTLLNILGGLMTMDEGELYVGGKKVDFRKKKYLLNYRRREVGFVVQYFALIDDMNVYKNVSLPLRYQGIPRTKIKQRTTKMLRHLGIEEKAKAYPSELSGGQQQRAAIARALVKNARIILADEPTGALDEGTGDDVMKLFQRLKKKDRAIIIVTHDNKVAEYCDRVVYLRDGMNARRDIQ
ncbi:ABC transporter ATP-binding protein [Merdimonas faecis]|uniref:ABC transporter ATP-binding protein n=1 Tax=Merdimonas faecis TaxID=1653435 RepID=UPI0023F71817|nr:ABC transporter ATP-binding protein [Merdimonas faecis]